MSLFMISSLSCHVHVLFASFALLKTGERKLNHKIDFYVYQCSQLQKQLSRSVVTFVADLVQMAEFRNGKL